MRRLPVAAFAVLAVLTVAAFFITQHLKTTTPLVLSKGGGAPGPDPAAFNPTNAARTCRNNEGDAVRFNKTQLRIRLQHSSEKVDVFVVSTSGNVVDTLSSGRFLKQNDVGVFTWDGRNASGRIVPGGTTYYFRIALANGGGQELTDRPISVITKDPKPKITGVHVRGQSGPAVIEPGSSEAQIRFKKGAYRQAWVRIYRTTASGQLTLVADYQGGNGATGTAPAWNGMIAGKPVPAGTYLVGLQVKDAACNLGTTPVTSDVVPGTTAGQGVTVRYVAAEPPLTATPAGSDATVFIDARQRPYTWQLRAVGASKVLEHGGKAGGVAELHVRLPGHGAGLYELTVAADKHSTVVPLLASASGHAASAHLLVVLPMLTWQGEDPVDDDGDGLPNTLSAGESLRLPRLLVSGLPAGFADDAQLLAYLNSQHVSYQLTTDTALALGQGPSLKGRTGVLLDGSVTWLPSQLASTLRDYVKGGGRVATIGLRSMQAQVKLTAGKDGTVTTGQPAPLRPDPFGVRHGDISTTGGLLVTVQRDDLDLFGGTDALQGVQRYQALTPPSGRVSVAGVAQSAPAVIAFTLGSGRVVEVGIDDFVQSLQHEIDSQEVMTNILKLLGAT